MARLTRLALIALAGALISMPALRWAYAQTPVAQTVPKVGVVNMARLYGESRPGREVAERLIRQELAMRVDVERQRDEIEALEDRIAASKERPPVIANLRAELAKKQAELHRASVEVESQIAEQRRAERARLEPLFMQVIEALGREQRFTVILRAGEGALYIDPTVELTDVVIRRLDVGN